MFHVIFSPFIGAVYMPFPSEMKCVYWASDEDLHKDLFQRRAWVRGWGAGEGGETIQHIC
jgi:hypothetical protein